jgi:iron complex transport system substrate-binding protein
VLIAACSGATATSAPTSIATSAPTPAPTAASTAPPTATPVAEFPVTVTDDEGTAVTIDAEPHKIVALTPAATETLFALGLGDRVVGKAQDVDLFPPEAAPIPEVAVYDAVDVEKVTGLEPDLVIAGGNNFNKPEAITQLRSLGIPVVVEYAPDIATVLRDIELTGAATGTKDEATAITGRMTQEMAKVRDAVKDLPKPRTWYELDATGAFYGPSDDSFLAEMLRMAGADPVTTGSPDAYDIPAERLIAANPELILLADAKFGTRVEDVAKRPGWSSIRAVQQGDIRPIDDTTVTRPGPRLFLGLALLARTIHPDAAMPSAEPIPAVP